jgi:hypothetical protein
MTGDIKDHEILKYIRNALNHHENGILYKYIEEENVIEIDLKDVRSTKEKNQNPNGEPKRFHVKIPVTILVRFMNQLSKIDKKNTQILTVSNEIDYNSPNIAEELKKNLKLFRITIKGYESTIKELQKIVELKQKGEELKNELDDEEEYPSMTDIDEDAEE